jgi:hypothetical protein
LKDKLIDGLLIALHIIPFIAMVVFFVGAVVCAQYEKEGLILLLLIVCMPIIYGAPPLIGILIDMDWGEDEPPKATPKTTTQISQPKVQTQLDKDLEIRLRQREAVNAYLRHYRSPEPDQEEDRIPSELRIKGFRKETENG